MRSRSRGNSERSAGKPRRSSAALSPTCAAAFGTFLASLAWSRMWRARRPPARRRLRAESHWPRRVAVTPLSLLKGRLPARAAEGSGAPAKQQPCARPRQERTGVALKRGSPSGRLLVRGAGGRGCRRGCSPRGRRSCRSPRGPSSLLRGAARSPRGAAGCGRCGEKGCLVTRWLPEGESMEGGPDSPEGSLPQPPSLVLPLF